MRACLPRLGSSRLLLAPRVRMPGMPGGFGPQPSTTRPESDNSSQQSHNPHEDMSAFLDPSRKEGTQSRMAEEMNKRSVDRDSAITEARGMSDQAKHDMLGVSKNEMTERIARAKEGIKVKVKRKDKATGRLVEKQLRVTSFVRGKEEISKGTAQASVKHRREKELPEKVETMKKRGILVASGVSLGGTILFGYIYYYYASPRQQLLNRREAEMQRRADMAYKQELERRIKEEEERRRLLEYEAQPWYRKLLHI